MSGYPVNRYREAQIMTASPEQVLIALYDGAIRFAQEAKQAIGDRDAAAKGKAVDRTLAIIGELNGTLDHDKAPEVCANLMRLYSYMTERLSEASLRMDQKPLDEVIRHLNGMRQTWLHAIDVARGEATR